MILILEKILNFLFNFEKEKKLIHYLMLKILFFKITISNIGNFMRKLNLFLFNSLKN